MMSAKYFEYYTIMLGGVFFVDTLYVLDGDSLTSCGIQHGYVCASAVKYTAVPLQRNSPQSLRFLCPQKAYRVS